MFRRSVRIACLVVGLLATAGLAYRAFQDEDALESRAAVGRCTRRCGRHPDRRVAARPARLAARLRRARPGPALLGQARPGNDRPASPEPVELDGRSPPSGGSLTESLDAVDQLTAAERRARTYVSRGEMQLAGDVIFTEIRDLLAAATTQVESIRGGLTRATRSARGGDPPGTDHAGRRRHRGLDRDRAAAVARPRRRPAVKDPAEWRNELKETLKKPIPVAPEPLARRRRPPSRSPSRAEPRRCTLAALQQVSEICSDLSALADPGALRRRAGARQHAPERHRPDRLGRVERRRHARRRSRRTASIRSSSRASARSRATAPTSPPPRSAKTRRRSAPPTATTPAALAVPMCGPTGPAGVLSVELKAGQAVDDAKVALAAIIAAQLATLAMPISHERAGSSSHRRTPQNRSGALDRRATRNERHPG